MPVIESSRPIHVTAFQREEFSISVVAEVREDSVVGASASAEEEILDTQGTVVAAFDFSDMVLSCAPFSTAFVRISASSIEATISDFVLDDGKPFDPEEKIRLVTVGDILSEDIEISSQNQSSPNNKVIVPILYGEYRIEKLPATRLKESEYILANHPLFDVYNIYKNGELVPNPVVKNTNFGARSVCIFVDSNAVTSDKITYSCAGAYTGDGILVNPADVLIDLLIRVQGHSPNILDGPTFSAMKINCLSKKREVKFKLDKVSTARNELDNICISVGYKWVIVNGKIKVLPINPGASRDA